MLVILVILLILSQVRKQNKYLDRPTSTFALEWEEKMKDYEPDYVYMIPVGYKKREIYYENITHVPVIIRGAFLTDEDKKDKIDFEVNRIKTLDH